MIDVVSIKFKNRGKAYFFDPNGLDIKTGQKVIVETAKGLDIADCVYGNHAVMDTTVVQPLRPVVRIATADDLRIEEINKKGTTVLLVEQNAKRALAIADHAYVLETGNITLHGTGQELSQDERVQKAYLGG